MWYLCQYREKYRSGSHAECSVCPGGEVTCDDLGIRGLCQYVDGGICGYRGGDAVRTQFNSNLVQKTVMTRRI